MPGRIGFMQGRLSPLIGGKIQAFPVDHWREEFRLAAQNGFDLMEWTLDHEGLSENPLMTSSGRQEIRALQDQYGLEVRSLTADCFMQAPFYKHSGARRAKLLDEVKAVLEACAEMAIGLVVVPLVDNGGLRSPEEEDIFERGWRSLENVLKHSATKVVFESDFPPKRLADFIERWNPELFGINYDIGNSAALGYSPREELEAYAPRVLHVHIKDRKLGGTTVPLGTGAASLPLVFRMLARAQYRGDYILQTARASDSDHVTPLCRYRDQARKWLEEGQRES